MPAADPPIEFPIDLNHRESDGVTVTLVYHGPGATPLLTIVLTDERGAFEFTPPEQYAVDAFNHPYVYLPSTARAAA